MSFDSMPRKKYSFLHRMWEVIILLILELAMYIVDMPLSCPQDETRLMRESKTGAFWIKKNSSRI